MNKDRFVVDIHITGYCNMNCQFCCGAPKNLKGPDYENFKQILDKLVCAGITTLVFTGGEPLLNADLFKCIKYTKENGIEVYLSTNGLLLQESVYDKISKYLSVLGIPLDGSTPEINGFCTRDPKLYDSTLRILQFLKRKNPSHVVKVGTVATRRNIDDLENIGHTLFDHHDIYTPDVWRIYQFSSLMEGSKHKKEFFISDEEYLKRVKNLKRVFDSKKISALSDSSSDSSYFFVNPRGILTVLENNEYKEYGPIIEIDKEGLDFIFKQNRNVIQRGSANRAWLSK